MQVLLAAINSKYIHSNLAIYSLKAFHDAHTNGSCNVMLGEYTINQMVDDIIADLYEKRPDVIAFSCYIWNIKHVYEITKELKKIMPDVKIWLGGPEVSFDSKKILQEHCEVDGVMSGEGEFTFSELCNQFFLTDEYTLQKELINKKIITDMNQKLSSDEVSEIRGITYRFKGEIIQTPSVIPMNMDDLPFIYDDLDKFKNKIIYYESSRGCPYGCSYCLSSVDKNVRFRSLNLVFKEIEFFLDNRIAQVKFVDRTFNCSHERTLALLEFLKEHDNGVTNFHFEIAADLLREDEIELLNSLRPGLVQLEIGVQSTNIQTIHDINRVMDFNHLSTVVQKLNMGKNVHLHLDLIAGLPNEDIDSFHKSFNDVYGLAPEQLQLGFLKVLKGSPMELKSKEYGIVYKSSPPYEVMKTNWISYDDVLHLKQIEDMVEVYYNSGQYVYTIDALTRRFKDAFGLFDQISAYYSKHNLWGIKHSRISRYEYLYEFIQDTVKDQGFFDKLRELLIFDLYLRENLKSRPVFADSIIEYKNDLHALYSYSKAPKSAHIEMFSKNLLGLLPEMDILDLRSIYKDENDSEINKSHFENVFKEERDEYIWILFDYEVRDPLNYNSEIKRLVF